MQLASGNSKDLLRFITCGSVDDGKSTLIGRLLFDSQLLSDDQLAELRRDSRNRITPRDEKARSLSGFIPGCSLRQGSKPMATKAAGQR